MLPQHLTKGVGGTIYTDRQTLAATAVVTVVTGSGTVKVDEQDGTVSTIDTTLAAAASRGDTSLSVADATGINAGSVFWIQDDPEPVLVYLVSGTDIYLRRPLLKDHASGATAEGTRCSYTVSADDADAVWWDGRAKWVFDDASIIYEGVECTEYPLPRVASLQNVFDRHPMLYEVIAPTQDTERLLDLAHEEVLQRIGARARARVFTGASEFVSSTVLAFLALHYESIPTPDGTALYERYSALLESQLNKDTSTTPRNADQDGVIESTDRMSYRTISLRR